MRGQVTEPPEQDLDYLRDLVENVNDLIQSVRPDGTFVYVNRAWRETLGYGRDEIARLSIFDVIHPDSRSHCEQVLRRVLAGENLNHVATTFLAKDGRAIELEGSVNCRFEHGRPIATRSIFHDITERRRAEERLRKSQASLEGIVNTVNGIVWEVDARTFQFRFVSPQAERILGYPVSQWLTEPDFWRDHIHPEDRDRAMGYCLDCTRRGVDHNFEYRMLAADGGEVWLQDIVTVESVAGQAVILRGIMVDISEHKRAEEALRNSEALYASLVQTITVNLFRKDLAGRFTFANQRFCDLVGKPLAEIRGKTDADFYPPELAEAYRRDDQWVLDAGTLLEKEEQHQTPEGDKLYVHVLKAPVHDAAGRLIGIQGIFWDVTEHKRAEEALRIRAKQLADAQELAQLGGWEWDAARNVVTWSEQLYHIFGLRPDEFAGNFEGYLARVHPEDQDRTRQIIEQALRDQQPFRFEERIVRPDGVVRFLDSQGEIVTDERGQLVRMTGICQDITERKRAEEALRASEERFRKVWNQAGDGMRLTDASGVVLMANDAYCRLVDLPREAVEGHTLAIIQPPEQRERVIRQHRERFVGRLVPVHMERELTLWNGKRKWLELTNTVLDGHPPVLLSTFRDITERKRAEEALRENESFLQMSQRVGRIGSWHWDLRTNQVRWSETMYQIYGLSSGQFDGTLEGAVRTTHPEDLPTVQAGIRRIIEGGEIHPLEFRIFKPDGQIAYLWGHGEVIRDPSGKPVQVIGTVMDISERKRAEENRRTLEAQIQHAQKLESLGILAGGIAHDFNNLLTSMLGYASLALMQLPDESPAVSMLREIEKAAQRAADLTQQMLAYSGRGKFVIQVVRLDTLVHEMTKLLGTVVSRKASVQLHLEPATVEGDATQIRQVVMNLITNASDALEGQSGAIDVRTGRLQADTAFLRSPFFPEELPTGDYAFVEVKDSGSGMSEKTLARIFDPFFTTKFTGRGLGLAAALGIVRGHRGTIKVDSTPGRGTSFQVLFPCSTATRQQVHAPRPSEAAPTGQGLILVVEDEPSLRTFARRVLEGAGFRVLEAGDGHEGLDLFGQHRQEIVAVLLDLTMPRMDGMETLRELRMLQPDVPVLVMSGYSDVEVSMRFAGLGVSGFIQKPFHPRDLIARVCQILPSRAASGRQ